MNQHKKQDRLSPGQLLRRARTAKQWSIEDVRQRLKLPTATIKHLESSHCDFSDIYQRGYAVNYAKLLQLDLDQFEQSLGDKPQTSSPPPSALTRPPQIHRAERFLRFATYALGTAVVAVPLVWSLTEGAADFFTQGSQRESASANAQSVAVSDGSAVAQRGAQENSGKTPSHLSASVAPLSSIGSRASGNDEPATSVLVTPPLAGPPPRGAATDSQAGTVDGGVLTTVGEPGVAMDADATDLTADLRLSLQSDSWVEITDAAGRRLEYDLLLGGSVHTYEGEAPYRILIGRAIGVELEHQGQRVDLAPYIRGNVASFELASNSAVENNAPPQSNAAESVDDDPGELNADDQGSPGAQDNP